MLLLLKVLSLGETPSGKACSGGIHDLSGKQLRRDLLCSQCGLHCTYTRAEDAVAVLLATILALRAPRVQRTGTPVRRPANAARRLPAAPVPGGFLLLLKVLSLGETPSGEPCSGGVHNLSGKQLRRDLLCNQCGLHCTCTRAEDAVAVLLAMILALRAPRVERVGTPVRRPATARNAARRLPAAPVPGGFLLLLLKVLSLGETPSSEPCSGGVHNLSGKQLNRDLLCSQCGLHCTYTRAEDAVAVILAMILALRAPRVYRVGTPVRRPATARNAAWRLPAAPVPGGFLLLLKVSSLLQKLIGGGRGESQHPQGGSECHRCQLLRCWALLQSIPPEPTLLQKLIG